MKRICLISPGQLATNPRLVKEAQALTRAGFDVRVVCGRYAPWASAQDVALADPRWSVTYVPFGPFEASRSTYVLQTLRRHVARALVRAGTRTSNAIESAHAPATPGLCAAARKIPADLYIAHYVAALPAAASAARRHGALYAFDAEDFHLGDLPDAPAHALEKTIIREIEARYLPGAAYITAGSPMIAEAYARTHALALPITVLNVFPRTNGPGERSQRGSATPRPSLYWFSQTIGPGRGLETAVEAVACASSAPHLYLRGALSPGYEPNLRALAASHDAADRLHILPAAPPSDMERLGAQYDAGFVGDTSETRSHQMALSNKLFSYLCSGIPVFASDIPAHQAIAAALGPAMHLFRERNAAALAAALDALFADPLRMAAAREHAWRLGQERYCWEIEQKALITTVEGALGARSQRSLASEGAHA